MSLPAVLRCSHVPLSPERAFALFTNDLSAWWPLMTHSAYGADSGGVAFGNELLVERSVRGRTTVWAEVLDWQPGRRLLMTWHPGRDRGPASRVEVTFTAAAGGTRLDLRHDGFESFADAAGTRRSYAGRDAWGFVLDHFADLAEWSGQIGQDDELAAMAEAYQRFFTAALAGGFRKPHHGAFSAAQLVAHVAVHDDALAAVTRAVLAIGGRPVPPGPVASFDNEVSNDRAVLDALVEAHRGDLSALVHTGQSRAEQLLLLLSRLDVQERQVEVHVRLRDGGQLRTDGDVLWGDIALHMQTVQHLPEHTEQLRKLRRR